MYKGRSQDLTARADTEGLLQLGVCKFHYNIYGLNMEFTDFILKIYGLNVEFGYIVKKCMV